MSIYFFLQIKHKRLSKNSHDVLAEIFKKIGSKENTVQVSIFPLDLILLSEFWFERSCVLLSVFLI